MGDRAGVVVSLRSLTALPGVVTVRVVEGDFHEVGEWDFVACFDQPAAFTLGPGGRETGVIDPGVVRSSRKDHRKRTGYQCLMIPRLFDCQIALRGGSGAGPAAIGGGAPSASVPVPA